MTVNDVLTTSSHYHSEVKRCLSVDYFKVAGNKIFISMHLCKEYARSATTRTDNTRNIYENVPFKNVLLLPH